MNIREYYKELDNTTLQRLALNEANELTDKAVDVLIAEISYRGFEQDLIDNIKNQRKVLSEDELTNAINDFSNSGCPICSKIEKINALKTVTEKSVGVLTIRETKIIIGCKSCLDMARSKANKDSLKFGWWSINGIAETPIILLVE
jgi:ssDNA-binding Zn-finger/Zn-ribbon topoisomerase 1